MSLVVKRYGGIMAMKAKEKTFELDELDPATRGAVEALMKSGPAAVAGADRLPDSFVYSFEIGDDPASRIRVKVPGTQVPEPLRKLLP